jgi:hypothetical protein
MEPEPETIATWDALKELGFLLDSSAIGGLIRPLKRGHKSRISVHHLWYFDNLFPHEKTLK